MISGPGVVQNDGVRTTCGMIARGISV